MNCFTKNWMVTSSYPVTEKCFGKIFLA